MLLQIYKFTSVRVQSPPRNKTRKPSQIFTLANERRWLVNVLIPYLKSRELRREWDKISGAMITLWRCRVILAYLAKLCSLVHKETLFNPYAFAFPRLKSNRLFKKLPWYLHKEKRIIQVGVRTFLITDILTSQPEVVFYSTTRVFPEALVITLATTTEYFQDLHKIIVLRSPLDRLVKSTDHVHEQ